MTRLELEEQTPLLSEDPSPFSPDSVDVHHVIQIMRDVSAPFHIRHILPA